MLKELVVKIGADTTEFIRRIGEVRQMTSNIGDNFSSFGSRMSDSFSRLGESLKTNGEKFKDFGQSAFQYVSLPLLAGAGASIKLASDMQESLNKVNVSFGESAGFVKEWAKTSIDNMGMASGSALDSAALFGDMATSMGISKDQASNMATSLVQLGADLASFKNIGVDQAMNALNGVFTGETESLKMLGVVMTQTQLEAFALSQGIKKNVKDMTEAEMVNLRYAFVLDRTKNAQGDFARTNEGTANQMRIFWERLKQLGTEIGDKLLPYFNDLIKYGNDLLKGFSNLTDTTKNWIIAIGLAGIALPPLIISLGVIMTTLPLMASGFRAVGVAMQLAFLNPIGLAITALIGLGVWLYKTQGSLENVMKYLDQVKLFWGIFAKTIVQQFVQAYYKIKLTFKELELKIIETVDSVLKYFGITFDSIESKIKDLKSEIKTIEVNQLTDDMKRNSELAKDWSKIYELEVSKSISNAQDAMANASYESEQLATKIGNVGKAYYEAKNPVKSLGDSLTDSKTKAEELARKTEELRKKNLDLANTLQNAVVTALRNKNKAVTESINKLKDAVENEKKSLDDLKKHNEETYQEIQKRQEDYYNNQFDKLKSNYDDQLLADQNLTQQKIDEVELRKRVLETALNDERKLQEDQTFEEKKQRILQEMITLKNLKTRVDVVDALSKLVIDREKEMNKDGNSIRLEAMKELTDDEFKIVKDRLNQYRQTTLDGFNKEILDIKSNAELQKQERQTQYQKELEQLQASNKAKILENQKAYENAQLMAEEDYQKRIDIFNKEITEKKKGLLDLTNEQTAQLKARQLLLSKDHEEVKKLLKDFNADYFSAGKDYGQSLIDGLNTKKSTIQSLVDELAKPSATKTTTNTPAIDWKGAGAGLVDTIKSSIGDVISNAKSIMNPPVAIAPYSLSEISPYSWLDMSTRTQQQTPQIFLDSKEITKQVAPVMVDYVRTKTGVWK